MSALRSVLVTVGSWFLVFAVAAVVLIAIEGKQRVHNIVPIFLGLCSTVLVVGGSLAWDLRDKGE